MLEKLRTRKFWTDPRHVFVAVALMFGGIFVFGIPPMQAPDELAHYFRAYQVSTGQIISSTYTFNGVTTVGGTVPESVKNTGYELLLLGNKNETVNKHISLGEIKPYFSKPLKPHENGTAQFAGAALYTPVPYAPQALGIGLGRLAHAPPIILLYLGRLMNLLVFIGCVYMAIRIMPFGKWLIVVIALLPTTLTQAASISADAATNALAFLVIAFFLYLLAGKAKLSLKSVALLGSLVILLALCKQTFLLFAAFMWILPARRFKYPNKKILLAGGVTLGGLILLGIWSALVADFVPRMVASFKPELVIDPGAQLVYVLTHPIHFVCSLLVSTGWNVEGTNVMLSLVGTQYSLPLIGIGISYCTLLAVSLEKTQAIYLASAMRKYIAVLAVAGVLGIGGALYLGYNSVGSSTVEGLNGRYFIPLLPLVLLMLSSSAWKLSIPKHAGRLLAIGIGVPLVIVVVRIAGYYYGWHIGELLWG